MEARLNLVYMTLNHVSYRWLHILLHRIDSSCINSLEYGYSFSTSSGNCLFQLSFCYCTVPQFFLASSGLENMNLHLLSVLNLIIYVSLTSYTVMCLSSGRFGIIRLSEESFSD